MKNSINHSTFKTLLFNLCLGFLLISGTVTATNDTTHLSSLTTASIFQEFSSDEVVNITLETAIDSLIANKKTVNYQAATISVNKGDFEISYDIKVRPRGRSRRTYCDFPPLKLNFSKKDLTALGLNSNYKSIKLVTHCSDSKEASNNVLEEYLAYKLYNVLTGNSFQAQLVKVNYIDSNTGHTFNRFGILLENTKEMAERIGGKEMETMGIPVEQYNQEQLNLLSVFQFMIGNEDWRLKYLRNTKMIQMPNGGFQAIPYDFDAAGLVNAAYARPDRDLRLESVLQRQFMGSFSNKKERAITIDYVVGKKETLLQTVQTIAHLDANSKKQASQYINDFFNIIENRRSLNMAMPVKGRTPFPSDINGAMK